MEGKMKRSAEINEKLERWQNEKWARDTESLPIGITNIWIATFFGAFLIFFS